MSMTAILEANVQSDKKQALLDFLANALKETREYPGFISISILTDENSNTVIFYSQWQKPSDYQSYLDWRTQKGDLATIISMLKTEPVIRCFTEEVL